MKHIVVITPALSEPGGIASVVSAHLRSPLALRYRLEVIETVRGQGLWRHVRGAWGVIRGCIAAVAPSTCLLHVHASVGASFWRKATVIQVARLAGKPTLLHLHGGRFVRWVEAGGEARKRRVSRVFASADAVAVLSDTWGATVEGLTGRRDAVVLPNPVDIPVSSGAGVGGTNVVFLGRLDPRKGTHELLEAIRRIQSDAISARWTIAGDGDVAGMRERILDLPDPTAVSVPGWLDRDSVAAVLSAASVLCLPSYDEGLPMAVLEAMAYGVPCVVTPVGGIPDVIEDGINGVVVAVGNADELTRALERLLQEPEVARRIGAQARLTVTEGYSLERVAGVVEDIYASLGCPAGEGR